MSELDLTEVNRRLDKIIKLMVSKEMASRKSTADKVRYLNGLDFKPFEIRDLFMPTIPINSITSYIAREKNVSKRKVVKKT